MGTITGNVTIRNARAGLEAELLSQVSNFCWGRKQLCKTSAVQHGAGSPSACGYTHVEGTPTSQTSGGRSPRPTEAKPALVGGQTCNIPQGGRTSVQTYGPRVHGGVHFHVHLCSQSPWGQTRTAHMVVGPLCLTEHSLCASLSLHQCFSRWGL